MEKTKISLYCYGQCVKTWTTVGEVSRQNAQHSPFCEVNFIDENGKAIVISGSGHTIVMEKI